MMLDDYELGGAIAEATGGSTRWVDPAVVETVGRELRPALESAATAVEEVVDRYRRLPWYWRLYFRFFGPAA